MSVIPTVLDQSARGERAFDIYSLLLRERIVFLGQEVDDALRDDFGLAGARGGDDLQMRATMPYGPSGVAGENVRVACHA